MARVPISKISDDPKVQELLKTLDTNDDKHLETKEVDANGDGSIDCNPIIEKWLYTNLGPVENALFKAGLITKLKACICPRKGPITPDAIDAGSLFYFLENRRDYTFFPKGSKEVGRPLNEVPQGHIIASGNQLTTAGLGSCSAIAFAYEGKNFLGHIDASTSPKTITEEIRRNFDIEKLKKDKHFKILLWVGTFEPNHWAVKIIATALQELGLLDHLVFADYVTLFQEIGVNATGTFLDKN